MKRRSVESLFGQVPPPDTVRLWLAASIREAALLRSLLRLAVRKAALGDDADKSPWQADSQANGEGPR